MKYKNYILNDDDATIIKKSLIAYVENIAIQNNINRIILDTHNNLKRFEKYYRI